MEAAEAEIKRRLGPEAVLEDGPRRITAFVAGVEWWYLTGQEWAENHKPDPRPLAEEIHEALEHEFGDTCIHNSKGGSDGGPFMECEVIAQHILDHRANAGPTNITDEMVERGAEAAFLDVLESPAIERRYDLSKADWWESQVSDHVKNHWRDRIRAALSAALDES